MCAPAVLGIYVVATCKVGMWYPFSRDPFVADHYVLIVAQQHLHICASMLINIIGDVIPVWTYMDVDEQSSLW